MRMHNTQTPLSNIYLSAGYVKACETSISREVFHYDFDRQPGILPTSAIDEKGSYELAIPNQEFKPRLVPEGMHGEIVSKIPTKSLTSPYLSG